ncbi:sigma-70 family RNA polymerase sigma factor [Luteolibacter pohnpeiensis]|uniref:RNA polymerase sigma factor n=1 Tax=Luteolibacter pohnpeiensis TaxID=454153 RepID=A0A934SCD8_9BACT|nr:sigma-70 family RNA polymerase sigma factor [Luteolibacter pohnpeiensis]MBK1883572.1 sigma-70 family RNA polymerase sigma factor [Luteolibacter pohnpeiensis]
MNPIPEPITPERLMAEADALYGFAMMRMRDHHHAEELVQDAILTAWRKRGDFKGESSIKTWLIGILRFKILDFHRSAQRTPTMRNQHAGADDDPSDPMDRLFDAHGSWKIHPSAGLEILSDSPDHTVGQLEKIARLNHCIMCLPETLRVLFTARELNFMDLEDAADLARVAVASIPVLLTRARHSLRACLQAFGISPE